MGVQARTPNNLASITMAYEMRHREGMRKGGQVEWRGYAVAQRHDEGDHFRVSNGRRGHHDREHYFEPTHGYDRHRAKDGGDQGRVHYHDQRLEKTKVDIPYFDGGHRYDWLDRAKYFFHVYEVPREARVGVASFHLEGTVRKWW